MSERTSARQARGAGPAMCMRCNQRAADVTRDVFVGTSVTGEQGKTYYKDVAPHPLSACRSCLGSARLAEAAGPAFGFIFLGLLILAFGWFGWVDAPGMRAEAAKPGSAPLLALVAGLIAAVLERPGRSFGILSIVASIVFALFWARIDPFWVIAGEVYAKGDQVVLPEDMAKPYLTHA